MGTSCLEEPGCGAAPAESAEGKRARGRERIRVLPLPGPVTSVFYPFWASVSPSAKYTALSLEVMGGRRAGRVGEDGAFDKLDLWEGTQAITLSVTCRREPTSLPAGPPAGRWPLPLSRCQREMSSNKVSPPSFLVPISAFYFLQ